MGEQAGLSLEQSGPPLAEAFVGPQSFVLSPGPAPQVGVDALQEGIERGPVEPAVVRAGLAVLLAGGSPVGPTPSGVRSQRRG